MTEALIRVEKLRKEFRQGFWMRRVLAVKEVSFTVERGDIFGFLGPNGAGKTTTLKMLTGLISATSGSASLFGLPIPSPQALARIGFLPENPYVYPYLTPLEFVELCGSLSGLRGPALRARAREVLGQVGVLYAGDRPVRRLSKGMLQRTGIAAALVSDPELLILDEPMSGLDPVGRKEVRDLIVTERDKGRTILFSTHILGDVETLCDKVTILRQGEVVVSGRLDELLRRDSQLADVTVASADPALAQRLTAAGHVITAIGGRLVIRVEGPVQLSELLTLLLAAGVAIHEVTQCQETLEALFMREAIGDAAG